MSSYNLTLKDTGNKTIGIVGKSGAMSLTASELTTAKVNVSGRPVGRIRNRSGKSITILFRELEDIAGEAFTGSALKCYDEDNVLITKTIPDKSSLQMPAGLAGAEWLVFVLSTGTAEDVECIVYR